MIIILLTICLSIDGSTNWYGISTSRYKKTFISIKKKEIKRFDNNVAQGRK